MTENNKAVVVALPTSRGELYAGRLNKHATHINDLMDMHFGDFFEDEEVSRHLTAVYNEDTLTGKVEYDHLFAANRIIELARARQIIEIASLKPLQCMHALRVVLRRLGLMPWQRIERSNREAEAASE